MKRLIALVLAISLQLCAVFTVSAANGAQEEIPVSNEVELLKAFDIFDADAEPQKKVTRAEFAGYMARILNIEEYNRQDKLYFVDVPATYWKSNSINGLAELGIISGDGTNGFRPDDFITVSETASILLRVMGYDETAKLAGGYPNGYMKVFQDLKLDANTRTSDSELTNSDIARIFYNSFDTPIMRVMSSKGNTVIKERDESSTFLYEYKGIRSAKGRVTGINGISLNRDAAPDKGHICINDNDYECDDAFVRPFLGRYVNFWYTDNEDEGIKKVVFMFESRETDIVTISAEDIVDFNSDTYSLKYYKNSSSTKVAKINTNAEFIENGSKSVNSISQAISSLEFGQITLYDTDGIGGYDAVVLERYEICVAKSYDANKNVIYGDYIDGKQINVDEYETVHIFFDSGEEAKISDIRENDVLTVIRSDNYLEIYICRKIVMGTVESNGSESVRINGEEYPLNDYIVNKNNLIFNVGRNVTIRFNHTGVVVDSKVEGEGDLSYAYVRRAYRDEVDELFFSLYLLNNEFKTLEVASKVKVDGILCKEERLKDGSIEKTVFGGSGISTPMLIRYAINDDGQICEIDTAKKRDGESENTLTCNQDFDTLVYNGTGRIGTKCVLSRDGTTVLAVPSDERVNSAELRDFQVGTPRTMLLGDVSYEMATYTIGSNEGAEEIAVFKRDMEYKVNYLSKLMVVSDVYTGVDTDNNVSLIIEGNGDTTYYMDPALYNGTIGKGDILHFEKDSENRIRGVEMLYKYTKENDGNPAEQWGGSMMGTFNDAFRLSWGYITSIKDNIIKWGYTSPDEVDEAYYWTQNVVFFDGEKTWSGPISQITTAETNPISPDRIIVKAKYGSISYVFVYKDPV